jgi:DNA-binding winged helix-turn-helix (wHTH) protein
MAREDSDAARSPVTGSVLTDEEPRPIAGAVAFGPYVLRASARSLEREGVCVQLGDRAFDILCALTDRAGQIITNQELMAGVWGRVVVGAGSLRFHINALRKVLAQDGTQTPYIKNVTRRGYTFVAPVRKAPLNLPGRPADISARAGEVQGIARLLSQSRFITLPGGIETAESAALIAVLLGRIAHRRTPRSGGGKADSEGLISDPCISIDLTSNS